MLKQIIIFIVYFSLVFPSFIFAENNSESVVVDRCVAVVNDEVITLTELDEEAAPTIKKIREQAPADQVNATIKQARKEILSEMIDRKLLAQRAEKRGVDVPDSEVDAAVDRILEQNNINVDQFRTELAAMGTTEEKYRESLRSQIVRSKLLNYEIRSKVVITNEQIEAYYYDKRDQDHPPTEGYHILQFGSAWGENGRSATLEESLKRAEQLREMVLAGESFKEIAQKYSDLPSAEDGGDIGIFQKNELADYMWQAIKDLRPGEISKVIETPAGYQFFKLISASQGGVTAQAPLDTVREEIRKTLYEQELKRKFDNWVKLLRENSYVEELL